MNFIFLNSFNSALYFILRRKEKQDKHQLAESDRAETTAAAADAKQTDTGETTRM